MGWTERHPFAFYVFAWLGAVALVVLVLALVALAGHRVDWTQGGVVAVVIGSVGMIGLILQHRAQTRTRATEQSKLSDRS